MRNLLTFLILTLLTGVVNAQHTKLVTGRIISEGLEALPKATIYSKDTTVIGSADSNGYFKIEIPIETNQLIVGYIGMEKTSVKLGNDCQDMDIIVMNDVIYDFMSLRKINKKRYKRFKKLPQIHQLAYEKGLFKSKTPCVTYIFSN